MLRGFSLSNVSNELLITFQSVGNNDSLKEQVKTDNNLQQTVPCLTICVVKCRRNKESQKTCVIFAYNVTD